MNAHQAPSPKAMIVGRTPVHPGEVSFYCEDVEGYVAVAGMSARCPCGCGAERFFWFGADADPDWGWNGNDTEPSLHREIGFPSCTTGWRGRLTHGRWLPRRTRRT
ncbi:MAG: hypothetical protein KGQ37_03750 [Hyphomicrobiales bacterium]|nr:hypothetical protein [Hyphomicrobiales bacterium]